MLQKRNWWQSCGKNSGRIQRTAVYQWLLFHSSILVCLPKQSYGYLQWSSRSLMDSPRKNKSEMLLFSIRHSFSFASNLHDPYTNLQIRKVFNYTIVWHENNSDMCPTIDFHRNQERQENKSPSMYIYFVSIRNARVTLWLMFPLQIIPWRIT